MTAAQNFAVGDAVFMTRDFARFTPATVTRVTPSGRVTVSAGKFTTTFDNEGREMGAGYGDCLYLRRSESSDV